MPCRNACIWPRPRRETCKNSASVRGRRIHMSRRVAVGEYHERWNPLFRCQFAPQQPQAGIKAGPPLVQPGAPLGFGGRGRLFSTRTRIVRGEVRDLPPARRVDILRRWRSNSPPPLNRGGFAAGSARSGRTGGRSWAARPAPTGRCARSTCRGGCPRAFWTRSVPGSGGRTPK